MKNPNHSENISAHFEEGRLKHEEFCSQLRIAAEDYKNEKTLGHQVRLLYILDLDFKMINSKVKNDIKLKKYHIA